MGSSGRPLALLLCLAGLLACGTSSTSSRPTPSDPTTANTAATTAPAATEAPTPAGPRKPSCDDGSCFLCGEGLCPTGFYCEASGTAPPACAWTAACAQKPTCACLAPHTKGCSCQDRDGGPHVTCGS